jgi:hypothetical protein
MITDVRVVDDARAKGMGNWSFGHLMTQMANQQATGIAPEEFVSAWLDHWKREVTVNQFKVAPRKITKANGQDVLGIEERIINPWPKDRNGKLILSEAPFRLLAIVNRLDLRNNRQQAVQRIGGGGAGEGRLVFCAVDLTKPDRPPLPFTVIFEYQIKLKDFDAVEEWAERWLDLADYNLGDAGERARYLNRLQRLTDRFTVAGADIESPPNSSALAQLRTNEIALDLDEPQSKPLSPPIWEIREFRIDAHNEGILKQVTVKQTPGLFDVVQPSVPINGSERISNFVNKNEIRILPKKLGGREDHLVPVQFPTANPFVGAAAPVPAPTPVPVATPDPVPPTGDVTKEGIFWLGATTPPIRNNNARHQFSLTTCSGCHAREAFERPREGEAGRTRLRSFPDPIADIAKANHAPPFFTQIRPRFEGKEAQLSDFLFGKDKNGDPFMLVDPIDANNKRPFRDLDRRAADLIGVVRYGDYWERQRVPLNTPH